MERLYALSRALLLSEGGASVSGAIARHVADAFELQAVGLYDQRADTVWWAGSTELPAIDTKLRDAARRGTLLRRPGRAGRDCDSARRDTHRQHCGGGCGAQRYGAALDCEPGGHRTRTGAFTGSDGACRGGAAEQRVAGDRPGRPGPRVQDTAHVDEGRCERSSASPSTSARDRELVAIIDEDLDRFQALVTDAAQMLRIDAGNFAVHLDRYNLADAPSRRRYASSRGVSMVAICSHRSPRHSPSTPIAQLLGLALRQLLDNALEDSPPSSSVEIEARSNGEVEIVVRNSGSTIPGPEQARVVERFYRGAQARHVPGTGMGLAIVQQIARAHGGTLTISSSAADGTAFTLSLPRGGPVS